MQITREQIEEMKSRQRATFINSLAGYKQAVLVGSRNEEGRPNLAIFNSLLHIGAHPPLYGLLFRPHTVRRDTLENILSTGSYSLNYLRAEDRRKAHHSSAKFTEEDNEFECTGLTELSVPGFHAPFVSEAPVRIAMKLQERTDLSINGTILLIGSVEFVDLPDKIFRSDGFAALYEEDILACTGLDAYFKPLFLNRYGYAKPGEEPLEI